jgi:hypothetical protein
MSLTTMCITTIAIIALKCTEREKEREKDRERERERERETERELIKTYPHVVWNRIEPA